jgi:hypothetical protein
MQRRCPSCGSLDVRRSNTHDLDESPRTLLRSRYRCRRCSELFWVVSARTYRIAGIFLGVGLLTAAVVALLIAALGE